MKDTQYRISFYREILNNVGMQCRSRLASIDIRSARSMERAIEAGKRRFARNRCIPVWDHLADGFEVEEFRAQMGGMRVRGDDMPPGIGHEKTED